MPSITRSPGTHPAGARAFALALLLVVLAAPAASAAPEGAAAAAPPAPSGPTCDCKPYPCCTCNEKKDGKCPPGYENLRFLEDWKPCLCVPCCDREDWSDRLKARRITRDGFVWVNVGGQIRFRFESYHNIGFGGAADKNQSWMLARVRAHADVHVGDHARVFVEGIYADQIERRNPAPRPIDMNEGDVQNLFAEVSGTIAGAYDVGAWVGRRELQWGKQRLVSPLDWANTRRTFQGTGFWAKRGFHRVEGFAVRPVIVDPDFVDDEWDEDRLFWGLDYANTTLNCITWEVYALGLHDDATAARPAQDRYTVGARADGKIPNTRFDYDVEAAWQLGTLGAGDISAGMASATLGWSPCTPCWKPRLGVGMDWASGDDNAANPDSGTFDQLFPLSHAFLGHADLIARQNVLAARVEASIEPFDKVKVQAWYHLFWRDQAADAVYAAPGTVLRAVPAAGLADKPIGTELDVMVTYKIDRHWTAAAEWTRFFAGDFLTKSGAGQDQDFWWLGVQGTF